MKLWKGRFQKEADPKTNDFNSSISIDSRMYKEDIEGSIAHATMLGAAGIIDKGESEKICAELEKIEKDIETGALHIDPDAEDIHTFIEGELTARIGDAGKRLHTARSRNDQVALDVRLTLRKECAGLIEQLKELIRVLCDQAEEYADTVMPGYTHLQRAQPITFGHHLMAYAEMFLRDIGRMQDALKRMDVCPLGSGALAGTTYPLDRDLTAKLLGFSGVSRNSLDGVADRDFCAESPRRFRLRWCIFRDFPRRSFFGARGSLNSSSWTTRFPPAPASCRRRRTRILRSLSAARAAACSAT